MKKQYFKCSLAIFTAIITVLVVLVLPAGAKSAESDVQSWDFTKFSNVEVAEMARFERQTSSDGKILIGLPEKGYNDPSLSIKDGIVEMNCKNKNPVDNWWHYWLIQFKLDNDLKAGKTYSFITDLNITNTGALPTNFSFFYTRYTNWEDYTNVSGAAPNGENTVVYEHIPGEFESKINYTFTFTPEADLKAGGYLAVRFNTRSAQFDSTISMAKITTAIPSVIDVADEWDFNQFDDTEQQERLNASYAQNPTLISKDNKIKIGACEDPYNICSLNIKNGSVTISRTGDYSWGDADYRYVLLQFRLENTLKAGKSYTFNTDFTVKNSGKWPSDFYFFYTTQTGWGDGAAEPNAAGTVVFDGKSGGFDSKTNYTFTFVPTTDLAAGGYLALRFNTKAATFTSSISKARLIENNISDNIKLLEGAQVRYNTPTGLRFISKVNAKTVTDLNEIGATDIKFGTLIVPEDYLTAEGAPEFTKSAFTAAGKRFLDIEYTGKTVAENENDYFEMKAAIVKIKPGNYNRNFAARSYVSYKIDGKEYTTYSDYDLTNNSRSVKYVATKLMEDTEEYNKLSEEQKKNVNAFTQ